MGQLESNMSQPTLCLAMLQCKKGNINVWTPKLLLFDTIKTTIAHCDGLRLSRVPDFNFLRPSKTKGHDSIPQINHLDSMRDQDLDLKQCKVRFEAKIKYRDICLHIAHQGQLLHTPRRSSVVTALPFRSKPRNTRSLPRTVDHGP